MKSCFVSLNKMSVNTVGRSVALQRVTVDWPPLPAGDPLQLKPMPESELALQCLGAVTWYLQRSLLDTQLLSMRR